MGRSSQTHLLEWFTTTKWNRIPDKISRRIHNWGFLNQCEAIKETLINNKIWLLTSSFTTNLVSRPLSSIQHTHSCGYILTRWDRGVGQSDGSVEEGGVRQSVPEWIQWIAVVISICVTCHVIVSDGWNLGRMKHKSYIHAKVDIEHLY